MADETTPNSSLESDPQAPAEAKPAAKAKKEKPPALEDKPFAEFIQHDYFKALQTAFQKQGIEGVELKLVNQKIPVRGMEKESNCWQVAGAWAQRHFNLYFLDEDIQGRRAFSCTLNSATASTLEAFLGDERKITLDLLVFGLIQRLNGQKWLARN
jgi:Protein of unknown function (DUF2996)